MDYKKYADAFFEYIPPKQEFRDRTSEAFNLSLEVSPNVFDDIQYESDYGKKKFTYVTGRVDSVISPSTGQKLGDDFKNFIFSNSEPSVFVGELFKWKNNYWIATNTNTYESVSNNCVVRRCNNMLKWIDKNGNILSEPCIMIETIKQSNDYSGDKLTTVSGFTGLFCQRNENTNKIVSNQRFLFGTKENRKAFRVFGDGVKNFLNSVTDDDTSPSVIELTIGGSYVYPDIDDLVNGIPNRYLDSYTININDVDFDELVGYTKQLTATVKRGDDIVLEAPVKWETSNENVISVTLDGVIELIGLGTATITCTLGDNGLITDTILITSTSSKTNKYEIKINPNILEINEGLTEIFTINLYENDIKILDTFEFTILGTVPSNQYLFTPIDGNSFSIKNKEAYFVSPLIIRCVSGIHSQDIQISLKGAW